MQPCGLARYSDTWVHISGRARRRVSKARLQAVYQVFRGSLKTLSLGADVRSECIERAIEL